MRCREKGKREREGRVRRELLLGKSEACQRVGGSWEGREREKKEEKSKRGGWSSLVVLVVIVAPRQRVVVLVDG